ncbi:MAG: EamA family transporter RarD [Oceanipulchritudo sp.]
MLPAARGLAAIILAYAIWGLIPVYWKLLTSIGADELLYCRLILTAASCLLILRVRRDWADFPRVWRNNRTLRHSLLAAALLSVNWFSFMWAVNNNRVLESSLGYFLCPLVSVLLGRFVEKEHLGTRRWIAVGLAAAGVGIIISQAAAIPFAAVSIALTWGGYGLMKKRSQLGPLTGLGMETLLLSPLAAVMLIILAGQQPLTALAATPTTQFFLAIVGFVTLVPLLLFAYAARRIQLSTMGMGQYIVPSCHFGLALLYGETVNKGVLAGFALIWGALAVYSVEGRRTKDEGRKTKD